MNKETKKLINLIQQTKYNRDMFSICESVDDLKKLLDADWSCSFGFIFFVPPKNILIDWDEYKKINFSEVLKRGIKHEQRN